MEHKFINNKSRLDTSSFNQLSDVRVQEGPIFRIIESGLWKQVESKLMSLYEKVQTSAQPIKEQA